MSKRTELSEHYSDALVELGNQAWILNLALAELHGVKGGIAKHIRSQPDSSQDLAVDLERRLLPAIARLQTRLQALLSKWQRRMAEESTTLAGFTLRTEPWGYQLELPVPVRRHLQLESHIEMSLAEARLLAAAEPNSFFTVTASLNDATTTPALIDDPVSSVSLNRFYGMDLSVAKMWWSWCHDGQQLQCRLQPLSDNLWQSDSCTIPVAD